MAKYWGQYTALGDTFLENLQGLTTLKIYQADDFKQKEMIAEKLPTKKSDIIRKVTAIAIYAVLFALLLRYVNGITTFLKGTLTA